MCGARTPPPVEVIGGRTNLLSVVAAGSGADPRGNAARFAGPAASPPAASHQREGDRDRAHRDGELRVGVVEAEEPHGKHSREEHAEATLWAKVAVAVGSFVAVSQAWMSLFMSAWWWRVAAAATVRTSRLRVKAPWQNLPSNHRARVVYLCLPHLRDKSPPS